MPLRLYFGLDCLDRANLGGLYRLDLKFLFVKSIRLDCQFGNGIRRLGFDSLNFVHIDGIFVDAAQSLVYIFEIVFPGINKCFVADQMEHDLGHAARFAVLCPRKNNILHLAAAKRFGTLLAEHPRDRIGNIGLAAAVGTDDRCDAAAGKNDLGVVGKRLKSCNFQTLKLKHSIVLDLLGSTIFCCIWSVKSTAKRLSVVGCQLSVAEEYQVEFTY